jgi:hypothetical protein
VDEGGIVSVLGRGVKRRRGGLIGLRLEEVRLEAEAL